MRTLDRAAGVVLGVAVVVVLVFAANAPITVHGSEQALLRLAWSMRPERVERCRQQSEEELARLPAHMRQPVICEGASAQYRLTVRHDGVVAAERIIHGGGLRQDRRIYVFHELPLDPGEGTIEVRFELIDPRIDPDAADTVQRETDHDDRQVERKDRQAAGETVPPHLILTQRLQIRPREVILVTYSPERRALAVIEGFEKQAIER